jgi:hypothetical protein
MQLAPTIEIVDNCLLDMTQVTKFAEINSTSSTLDITTS